MDELGETYAQITDTENRKMEFQAGIAGVELKPRSQEDSTPRPDGEETMKDRLRRRKQERQEKSGEGPIQGVGYTVIGG